MAFVLPAIAGLSALAGLFGVGKSSTSTSNFNSSTTPTYTPAQTSLMDTLMGSYQNEVTPASLSQFGQNYTTAGAKNIQTSAGSAEQAIQDALSARGIANTTAGAEGVADTSQSEAGQLSSFLNQAPLLLDQRKQAILSSAGGFLSSLPVGSTTTGSSTTKGNVAPSFNLGGGLLGGASGLAGALGAQSAQTAAQKAQTAAGVSLANILKSINGPVSVNPGSGTVISGTSGLSSDIGDSAADNGNDSFGIDF